MAPMSFFQAHLLVLDRYLSAEGVSPGHGLWQPVIQLKVAGFRDGTEGGGLDGRAYPE